MAEDKSGLGVQRGFSRWLLENADLVNASKDSRDCSQRSKSLCGERWKCEEDKYLNRSLTTHLAIKFTKERLSKPESKSSTLTLKSKLSKAHKALHIHGTPTSK